MWQLILEGRGGAREPGKEEESAGRLMYCLAGS